MSLEKAVPLLTANQAERLWKFASGQAPYIGDRVYEDVEIGHVDATYAIAAGRAAVVPAAHAIWLRLMDVLDADNGHTHEWAASDMREAIPAIRELQALGFFADDPMDLEGSYWQAASGEDTERLEFFATGLAPLQKLDAVINRIFDGDSGGAADWTDARRYRLLRDIGCNNFSISRNEESAINHMSVADWIKDDPCQALQDVHPDELQRMAESNSLWRFQIYPNTPVSFYVAFGHSLDTVVDEVTAILADPAASDAQWKKANQLLEAVRAASDKQVKGS